MFYEIAEKAGLLGSDIYRWSGHLDYFWVFGPGFEIRFDLRHISEEEIVARIKALIAHTEL